MNKTITRRLGGKSKIFVFVGSLVFGLALAMGCSNPASSSSTTTASAATELKGVVTTLAGSTTSGASNGTGTAAGFYRPYGVATDGTNLYVGDSYNHMKSARTSGFSARTARAAGEKRALPSEIS